MRDGVRFLVGECYLWQQLVMRCDVKSALVLAVYAMMICESEVDCEA